MDFLNTLVKRYYDFFDNTIPDTSAVVLIIWVLVFGTWFLNQHSETIKSNIFERNNNVIAYEQKIKTNKDIIEINWKKYKIILEEVKK